MMQIATEHQNQHLPACIGSGDVVTSFGIVFIEVLYNSVLVLFLCVVVLFILLRDVFNVVCIVFVWGRKVWALVTWRLVAMQGRTSEKERERERE